MKIATTSIAFTVFAALALVSTLGCSSAPPPRLVVDPGLAAGADVYEVDGLRSRYWGKPLKFGPYHTEKTRVGETWAWSTGLWGTQFVSKNQPYRFQFVDEAGGRYQVECRAKTPILRRTGRRSEWSFPLGETKLSCGVKDPEGNVGSIALHGIAGDYSGETGFGGIDDFEIGALRRFANQEGRSFSLPSALGYELRQGGKAVATADVFASHPQVYLAHELTGEARTAAAITLTVLMFFEEES